MWEKILKLENCERKLDFSGDSSENSCENSWKTKKNLEISRRFRWKMIFCEKWKSRFGKFKLCVWQNFSTGLEDFSSDVSSVWVNILSVSIERRKKWFWRVEKSNLVKGWKVEEKQNRVLGFRCFCCCFLGFGAAGHFPPSAACVFVGKHFHGICLGVGDFLAFFASSFPDRRTAKVFPMDFPALFTWKLRVFPRPGSWLQQFGRNSIGSRRKWVVFTPFGWSRALRTFLLSIKLLLPPFSLQKKSNTRGSNEREEVKNKHKQKSHKRGTPNEN